MSKTKLIVLGIVAAIVIAIIAVIGWGVSTRNSIVTYENNVDNTWANVQTSYQRRMDLIPNLVATVKGYAAHEKSTLTQVTAMRAGAVDKAGQELVAANNAAANPNGPDAAAPDASRYQNLDRALSVYVNAVREAYPELMANENFMDLQKQLESTENRINTERNRYNESVRAYNTYITRFPANTIATMCGFTKKQFFQADAAAATAPTVSFE